MTIGKRTFIGGLIATIAAAAGIKLSKAVEQNAPPRVKLPPMQQQTIAGLPFKAVTVPGEDALAVWEHLRAEGKGWPVIVGDRVQLSDIADMYRAEGEQVPGDANSPAIPKSVAQILDAARKIPTPIDFKSLYDPGNEFSENEMGDWPTSVARMDGPSVAKNVSTNHYLDQATIFIVPTQNGWEVPAYLYWGGWNDCPTPEEHYVTLKYWHEQYGAELVSISGDVLELRRPEGTALTREQAIKVAQQQYLYCYDIVHQGVGSISALAASLMKSRWWYFWWD